MFQINDGVTVTLDDIRQCLESACGDEIVSLLSDAIVDRALASRSPDAKDNAAVLLKNVADAVRCKLANR